MRVGLARRRQIAAEERVGQKYGKLILESLLPPAYKVPRKAVFRCDCGGTRTCRVSCVVFAETPQHCGCEGRRLAADHIGKRFGRLVLKNVYAKGLYTYGYTVCDCGGVKYPRISHLISGATTSWGCVTIEHNKERTRTTNESCRRGVMKGYQRHSRLVGRDFALTVEQCYALFEGFCAYCGVEPRTQYAASSALTKPFFYNGIDRLDSSRGYTIENVVSCCKTCNFAKSNSTIEEWEAWMSRFLAFQNNRRRLKLVG